YLSPSLPLSLSPSSSRRPSQRLAGDLAEMFDGVGTQRRALQRLQRLGGEALDGGRDKVAGAERLEELGGGGDFALLQLGSEGGSAALGEGEDDGKRALPFQDVTADRLPGAVTLTPDAQVVVPCLERHPEGESERLERTEDFTFLRSDNGA